MFFVFRCSGSEFSITDCSGDIITAAVVTCGQRALGVQCRGSSPSSLLHLLLLTTLNYSTKERKPVFVFYLFTCLLVCLFVCLYMYQFASHFHIAS